jgi:RNA polymerase sigma-70 factor (ECF subfamily)
MLAHPERLLHHVRTLVNGPDANQAADAELLDRFVRNNDEAAFAALVARHGSMVHGVCRRMLRDAADADDVT